MNLVASIIKEETSTPLSKLLIQNFFSGIKKNRLRYNNLLGLGFVQLAFQNTLDQYPEANQIFSEIMRVFPKSAEEFNAMTDNEKVRTTNTIARALKAALEKFKN